MDDQPQVTALVATILQRRGFAVLVAAGALEAIRLFEQEEAEIAMLLTDIIMPGMNGVQLANRLTATRPQLPVVYMSGALPDEERPSDRCFLRKPFLPDELVQCVRAALKKAAPLP